jgi:hypothetical protein
METHAAPKRVLLVDRLHQVLRLAPPSFRVDRRRDEAGNVVCDVANVVKRTHSRRVAPNSDASLAFSRATRSSVSQTAFNASVTSSPGQGGPCVIVIARKVRGKPASRTIGESFALHLGAYAAARPSSPRVRLAD